MRSRATVIGLALVMALTGCGGAKSKGTAPSPTVAAKAASSKAATAAAKASVAKAVKAYSAALVAGKGKTAYPMLSEHCRTVITPSGFNALAAQAHATYPKAKLKKVTVTDVKGTQAHVTYTYAESVLDETRQSWVREHGAWRWNGC